MKQSSDERWENWRTSERALRRLRAETESEKRVVRIVYFICGATCGLLGTLLWWSHWPL